MTPEQRRARLKAIIEQYDEAVRAYQATKSSFDLATASDPRTVTVAIRRSSDALDQLCEAAVVANEAALALLDEEDS